VDIPIPPILEDVRPFFLPAGRRINTLRAISATLTLQAGTHTLYDPATAAKYLIFIAGVLRSDKMSIGRDALSLSFSLGNWPNASFTCISEDGTYRPAIDEEVVIVDVITGVRLFGGDIETPGESHEGGTSIIWTGVKAVGYASRLDRRVLGAYYDQTILWSTGTLIQDILRTHIPETGITFGGGATGSSLTTPLLLPWATATEHIRRILEPDGLDFVVDAYKRLYLVSKTSGYEAAPFSIAAGSTNVDVNSLTVRRERGRYANRITLLPDFREPGFWTDTWAGDGGPGAAVGFYLTSYILTATPIVKVNGVVMRVGEYWLSSGSNDFTYVPGGHGVQAVATYGGGDTIEIIYPIPLQPAIQVEDTAEIAANGIVDAIIQIRDVYDRDRLVEIASGELTRRKTRPYIVEYSSRTNGLRPGQLQNINTTQPLISNINVLIDSVNGSYEPTVEGGHFRWRVTAGNAQVQGEKSAVRTNQRIRFSLLPPQDRHRLTIVADLAMDEYPGDTTNPGLIYTGQVPSEREVDKPGYLKEVRLRFERNGTQAVTVQIDVRINGVTVFANGRYIEYAATVTSGDTVVKYDFSAVPFVVNDGDLVTVWIITSDAALSNGKCEVEIQG
jgi:uncharacterized protein YndB with AHSA1/START domain